MQREEFVANGLTVYNDGIDNNNDNVDFLNGTAYEEIEANI